MEPSKCPFECVRWKVEGRCVHVLATQDSTIQEKARRLSQERRDAKDARRLARVTWELDPLEWYYVEDWAELPHKEGVYIWCDRRNVARVVGTFVDFKRGHYNMTESKLKGIERIWYVETALTTELRIELIRLVWGSEELYNKTLSQTPLTMELLYSAFRIHPLFTMWKARAAELAPGAQQLELFE